MKKLQKRREPAMRPNALIIRMEDKKKYSEILKRVKKDLPRDQVGDCVDKIRKTTTGDMLIVLTKENTDKAPGLQKAIADLLGEEAQVVSKVQEEDLEIKDLDETTTKEEVLEALQNAAGKDCKITVDAIKSLRKAYGGTQTASVRLAVTMAKKVVGERGKIKMGWVNCRIRGVERPIKCWHFGHLANKCKSGVDRSKLCVKCGKDGHKVADCKEEAQCALCAEKGNTENCAHITGDGRCLAFQEALQALRNKRR
ncbi:gag-pol polyprotein [Lasius niger]|uniref:Gag-pol polyprotein n=1 Tax=Lasius niger TaxID=67767 RepID=A0A0J7KE20_LASNI|nr:gag-pol polyprotein [Lasius niger]